MVNIKYLEKHVSKKGVVTWGANPSKPLRDKLYLTYQSFSDKKTAVNVCQDWESAYADYKLGLEEENALSLLNSSSVGALINAYYSTLDFRVLAVSSKQSYRWLLTKARELRIGNSNITLGETKHSRITTDVVNTLYTQLHDTVSEGHALSTCKVLKKVWNVGDKLNLVKVNPFSKMGINQGIESTRTQRWEQEHINTFVAKADAMGLWSVGTIALLCYHLCQRPGDMRQLTWGDYKNGIFNFVQSKSRRHKKPLGHSLTLPTNPPLEERLSVLTRGKDTDYIVLNERTGRPHPAGINKTVAEIRKAAGLPFELKVSDLRRTGATELGEASCSTDEIMATTGHRSRAIVEVYVIKTPTMAQSASDKRLKRFADERH